MRLLAVLLVALAGCRGAAREAPPGAATGSPDDLQAITRLRDAFVRAYGESDVDRIVDLFTDDAVVIPPDEGAYEGKDEIGSYFGDFFDQTPSTVAFDVLETRVIGDWAYQRLDATLAMTHGDNGEETEVWENHLWILERQKDGAWKIARLIFNYDESGDEEDTTEPHAET